MWQIPWASLTPSFLTVRVRKIIVRLHCVTCSLLLLLLLLLLPDCSSHLNQTTMEAVSMATPRCRIKPRDDSHPRPHPQQTPHRLHQHSSLTHSVSTLQHSAIFFSLILRLSSLYLKHLVFNLTHPPPSYKKPSERDVAVLELKLLISFVLLYSPFYIQFISLHILLDLPSVLTLYPTPPPDDTR